MTKELKLCQHCKAESYSRVEDISIKDDDRFMCYVQCNSCWSRGPSVMKGEGDCKYDKAIEAWNAMQCQSDIDQIKQERDLLAEKLAEITGTNKRAWLEFAKEKS